MRIIQTRLLDAHGPDVLVRLEGGPADGTVAVCPPLQLPLDFYVVGSSPGVVTLAEGDRVAGAVRYLRRLNEDKEVLYIAEDLNVP